MLKVYIYPSLTDKSPGRPSAVVRGGKKKEPQQNPEQALHAIEKLRKTLDDLNKRQKVLEAKARNELENAKEKNRQKDKRAALYSLKKKKMFEAEVGKLDAMKMNMEQQIFMIEGAHTTVSVFDAMKTAQLTLKEQHRNVSVDQVDELRDQMEESRQIQDELSEALTQPMGNIGQMDDDELLNELDQLEALEAEEQMLDLGVPAVKEKPAAVVQSRAVPVVPVKKRDEMKDLLDEMMLS